MPAVLQASKLASDNPQSQFCIEGGMAGTTNARGLSGNGVSMPRWPPARPENVVNSMERHKAIQGDRGGDQARKAPLSYQADKRSEQRDNQKLRALRRPSRWVAIKDES